MKLFEIDSGGLAGVYFGGRKPNTDRRAAG